MKPRQCAGARGTNSLLASFRQNREGSRIHFASFPREVERGLPGSPPAPFAGLVPALEAENRRECSIRAGIGTEGAPAAEPMSHPATSFRFHSRPNLPALDSQAADMVHMP